MKTLSKVIAGDGKSFVIPVNEGVGVAVETLTDDTTLDAEHSGKKLLVGTDAKTLTLPATVAGLVYEVVNIGADGAVGITISPNASDKIMGNYEVNGSRAIMSGTDDKDIVNTKATAKKGDRIVLVGDGSDGWYIQEVDGVWTEEDQSTDDHVKAVGVVETLSDDKTLDANDNEKVFFVDTDAKTITLPATAEGLRYTIINIGADGAVGITVSPNASDAIMGTVINGGVITQLSETDDKDLVNTKATANNGDKLVLVGDGDAGWYVEESIGIWTEESQTVLNANPVTVQSVTANLTLTAADSGKVLLLNHANGHDITLPAPASGLVFEFIVALAFDTSPWNIATNAGANVIQGGAIVNSVFVAASDEDNIEFDEGAEAVGDFVRLVCDGTNWLCSGVGAGAGAIVFTAT